MRGGTCQNMQCSISHIQRNAEYIQQIKRTPAHLPSPLAAISNTTGCSTDPHWCSIARPLSCTLPALCVRVCVKQTCQFRLRWLARSSPAPAPRGYPSVPLSRCGKAECWMGYPVAPAWLLSSRRLNQSQIGLWRSSYEYIFLRLPTQENTGYLLPDLLQHADKHPFKLTDCCSRCLTRVFLFNFILIWILLFFNHIFSFSFSRPAIHLSFSISSVSLSLLSSQPSGQRLSFKVLILIWNLLQSAQRWTWNTGPWDPIHVCWHACLCSDGFLLQFPSKIINETPGRVVVKHVTLSTLVPYRCFFVFWIHATYFIDILKNTVFPKKMEKIIFFFGFQYFDV